MRVYGYIFTHTYVPTMCALLTYKAVNSLIAKGPHGLVSQMMPIFINTVVRTSSTTHTHTHTLTVKYKLRPPWSRGNVPTS
jgi:hypothetical protein